MKYKVKHAFLTRFIGLCLAPIVVCATQGSQNIEAYHNNTHWDKISAQQSIVSFFNAYPPTKHERAIDLCSGDGKISAFLAQYLQYGEVIGVDICSSMNTFAQKNYANTRLSFQEQDIQHLPFDNQFDLAVSFTCVQLIKDIAPVFESIEKSLKPGGKLLMQFPVHFSLQKNLTEVMNSLRWKIHFDNFEHAWHVHSPNYYVEMLEKYHLAPLQVETIYAHEVYVSRGEFQASLEQWLPQANFLPESLRLEFMEDLMNSYLADHPQDRNGYVHYEVDRLEIIAHKPV